MISISFFYFFSFIVGSAIGSFLGVLVDRTQTGESVLKGRSHCAHCNHTLHWIDLIPLLSFILLRGRCRYCHKKLSFYYPIIEVTTGLLFVLTVFILNQDSIKYHVSSITYAVDIFYYFFLISSLVAIFFTDFKFGLIPFKIVFPTAVVTFLYLLVTDASLPNALLSAVGAFIFFLIIFFGSILIFKKEGMGFGDVVYVFLMGLILGFPSIVLGLYIAFLTGGAFAILLVLTKIKKFRGGSLPFGPFLVLGTLISLFWGDMLIQKILLFLGIGI